VTAATSRLRRRGIGAGVAALVGLSGLGLSAAIPAQAVASFDLTRPADTSDRFATAASVATSAFTTSTNVIIANGDNAVDALSASYLAGTTTPILYVTSTSVPAATAAAITKLGATNAWVVGGTTAIPDSVVASLSTTTETRIAGADRYKTAVAVGTAKAAMGVKPTTAFIARGDQFADALAIAPVAAKSGIPILLTETGSLNADTLAALKAWGITNVTIVGGPSAVSENVVTSLTAQGVTSTRIAGSTRSSTATAIANTAAFGFAKTSVYVVNGFRPVDALPAAIAAAKANAPILLTEDGVLGADTQGYLTANAGTLTGGVAVGGTTVLPTSVETAAETAAKAVVSNATLAITPTESVLTGFSTTRQYSVAGLPTNANYRITLVNSANVALDSSGRYSFTRDASTSLVLPGTVASQLTVVNGVGVTGAQSVGGIAPLSNGALSFTVTTGASAAESFVPVVYVDGGASTRLEIDANNRPVEAFGVGGLTTVVPANAGIGAATIAPASLTAVSLPGNYLTTSSLRYAWDTNDVFQYQGVGISLDQFESAITLGQGLSINYAPDASGVSTFNLGAEIATTPTSLLATTTVGNYDGGTTLNDIRATFTVPATASAGTTFVLQRKVDGSADSTFATVTTATSVVNADATVSFTDSNVSAGSYVYRIRATKPVTGTVVNGDNSTPAVTVTAPADATPPKSTYAALTTSTGLAGSLDSTDATTFTFDRALAAVVTGDTIRVRDADGTIYDLINGTNATFGLNSAAAIVNGTSFPAGQVLTVTLTATPSAGAVVAAGTTAGLQFPATVIDQSGLATAGGVNWDVAGSSDITIS